MKISSADYMATFEDLGLSTETLKAIADAGYERPTPIQEKAIPYILMARDVLGCAQTGTGKTASFTLPMIEILSQGRSRARMPRSVILAPTRELAAQVAENFETYGKYHKLSMALLIGGVSFTEQEKKLDRGVDVLIATPGRLLDHFERGRIILTDVKVLVIDEADRMLDMGFIPDVEKIVSSMPTIRQTVMFSATMAKEVRKLAEKFLMNPKEITVDPPSSAADTVAQSVVHVSPRAKRKALRTWLKGTDIKNAIVFCNRKREVASLFRALLEEGFSAGALHGDMDQYKRMEWLEKFRTGEVSILVCSDVAARGLDIPAVGHVFNYDVPTHAEDYIHRIGRTGRAGRSGETVMLATDADAKSLKAIEKLLGKSIPTGSIEGISDQSHDSTEEPSERKEEARSPRGRKSSAKKPSAKKEVQKASDNRRESERPRGRRRGHDHDIGEMEEMKVPFGKSGQVPAFLLR